MKGNFLVTDWEKYRRLFPHVSERIYLNHAGIAPFNLRGKAALLDFVEKRLETDIEFWPAALEKKAYFLEMIGRFINAPKENVALVTNTSAGLNILTLGLSWKAGDRILLNDFEFPANVIPFTNLKRLGVEIDWVHHHDGILEIDDIRKKITPRTRLLSISLVEFINGFRNDIEALGKICRERGIIFSVDAIQALGALKVDVEEMGIDFMSSAGNKWLMWPAGLGFIYISPRIFPEVYPVQAGWMSLQNPLEYLNYNQPFDTTAQRFEPGVFNTMGIMTAIPTLGMMLEIGIEAIEQKVLNNTRYLIQLLRENGYKIYSSTAEKHLSGIVTFFHSQAEQLYSFLKEQQVYVSLREGKIRVSPHFYNNENDLETFMKKLRIFKK
jgi:selenocysteine lyase/cysteine desulfurase